MLGGVMCMSPKDYSVSNHMMTYYNACSLGCFLLWCVGCLGWVSLCHWLFLASNFMQKHHKNFMNLKFISCRKCNNTMTP
ncbi:hypothetical protein GDO81_015512 [Engystomops pustulosus]|uniref:Uncharacterized protein n=1 Tax=Engystomops pustulosus TaxID=76066 RepID=A0AAV7AUU6_ENGPU|nr:hypothetical protein GDO81_015512 [Engystomops pustulosus]